MKSSKDTAAKRIYLDYASAPPVLPEAEAAVHAGSQYVGNPGAIHAEGVQAKRALDGAREEIAALLGVKAREIIFTGGLTDANNIAILGAARSFERTNRGLEGSHWIVSSIEHTSVLDCFTEIERLGGTVTHIDPDDRGIITAEKVVAALNEHTVLVSIGWANNEIGTIQPLSDISRAIAAFEKELPSTSSGQATKILLHTDAGQAPLYFATGLNSLGADLCAIGGNKLYGPHGVGCLFLSNRAELARVQQGGPQERGLRPGTENVALALGFAAAFKIVASERLEEARRIHAIRDALSKALIQTIPGLVVNGDSKRTLPHMLNVSFPAISTEYVTLSLDQAGIAVSTKSACREGEESRSHVVDALFADRQSSAGDEWRARSTIRFSLGMKTQESDVSRIVDALVEIVSRNSAA